MKKDSKKIIFLYGSVDPWTAGAYKVGRDHKRRDVHKFILEGGTHGATLCDLPEPERTKAMRIIKRWTYVEPQCPSPGMERQDLYQREINIRKIKIPLP